MKKRITAFLICFQLILIGNTPEFSGNNIEINRNTLTEYRKNIDSFIDIKRHEKNQLSQLPDGNSFSGKIANFFIENVFAPLFNTYGNVNVEEAKIFLGRSFENEKLLKKAFETMPANEITLAYLHDIFSQARGEILNKKDGARFLEIVKKTKYKTVDNPKCMGEKDQYGNYLIPDAIFYPYSAATLMAFNIFENHVTISPEFKRHRKANSHAKP